MAATAADEIEIKRIENVIAKNKEEMVSFQMRFRCDPCIAKGRSALNDDGKDEGVQEEEEEDDDCTCQKVQKVTFKDSARFLSASLAKLTTNLKSRGRPDECADCSVDDNGAKALCASCNGKEEIKDVFKRTCAYIDEKFGAQHFSLLTSKQIYPYRYNGVGPGVGPWGAGTLGWDPGGWDPGG